MGEALTLRVPVFFAMDSLIMAGINSVSTYMYNISGAQHVSHHTVIEFGILTTRAYLRIFVTKFR